MNVERSSIGLRFQRRNARPLQRRLTRTDPQFALDAIVKMWSCSCRDGFGEDDRAMGVRRRARARACNRLVNPGEIIEVVARPEAVFVRWRGFFRAGRDDEHIARKELCRAPAPGSEGVRGRRASEPSPSARPTTASCKVSNRRARVVRALLRALVV